MSEEVSYSAESAATVSLGEIAAELGMRVVSHVARMTLGNERVRELGTALAEAMSDLTRAIPVPETSVLHESEVVRDFVKATALKNTLQLDPRFRLLGQLASRDQAGVQADAVRVIERAQVALDAGDVRGLMAEEKAIRGALETLSSAARNAHERLSQVEQRVLVDAAAGSLRGLGYRLAVKDRREGILVRGFQRDLSVAMEVTPAAEIRMDLAGFEGRDCEREAARIESALAERGVTLRLTKRNAHGKAEGGALTRACERETGWDFNPLDGASPSRRRARQAEARRRRQRV